MKHYRLDELGDYVLDLEKLLLYLAFYGSYKERRVMEDFFNLLAEDLEDEEVDSFDSPIELMHLIYARFNLDRETLDIQYRELCEVLNEKNIHFISILDDKYPNLLRTIKSYPLGLFYRGDINLLKKTCVSVVGSRKSTYDAVKMAEMLAAYLKDKEVVVASGLAFGVDSIIHKACLRHDVKTISVLPSCVDKPIPVSNRNIANKILEAGGLLISENPPDFNVRPESYVERNRIISGISDRTLVLEAAIKSGSMTTAKFALEQNRDLYAMVGSISNPVAKGTNYLISQGAKPLVYPSDFYQEPEHEIEDVENSAVDGEEVKEFNESEILQYIQDKGRVSVDEIIEQMTLNEVEIISKLTEYEIFGYINRHSNFVEINKD